MIQRQMMQPYPAMMQKYHTMLQRQMMQPCILCNDANTIDANILCYDVTIPCNDATILSNDATIPCNDARQSASSSGTAGC